MQVALSSRHQYFYEPLSYFCFAPCHFKGDWSVWITTLMLRVGVTLSTECASLNNDMLKFQWYNSGTFIWFFCNFLYRIGNWCQNLFWRKWNLYILKNWSRPSTCWWPILNLYRFQKVQWIPNMGYRSWRGITIGKVHLYEYCHMFVYVCCLCQCWFWAK